MSRNPKRNLPSAVKLEIDIDHIKSRHMDTTLYPNKTKFPPEMSARQVERLVKKAYMVSRRVGKTQNEIILQGTADGICIEIRLDIENRKIRSAYPAARCRK